MKKIFIAAALFAFVFVGFTATIFAAANGSVVGSVKWQWQLVRGMDIIHGDKDRRSAGVGWDIAKKKKQPTETKIAKLELIDADTNMQLLSDEELIEWYHRGNPPAGRNIFITQTTPDNTFAFNDVPEGEYFLVAVAPYRWYRANPSPDRLELEKYLKNWEQFELFTIGSDYCDVKKIKVRAGQKVIADCDFPAETFSVTYENE